MNVLKPQDPFYPPPLPPMEPPPFHWLADLLSFLRRRWLTMAGTVGIFVALALVYALTSTPRFTAQADLLIDLRRADILRQQVGVQDSQSINAVLESQVEVLRSEGLSRKVVVRLDLLRDPRFKPGAPDLMDRLRSLMPTFSHEEPAASGSGEAGRVLQAARQLNQMTSVRRVGQTYVLTISVTSSSPQAAAWLANGIAEAYIADQLEAKEAAIQQTTGWLQARIKELREQALSADQAVQDYKAQHDIINTNQGLMGSQQLTELTSQLVGARAHAAETHARLSRIETLTQDGVIGGSVADGLDNKVIVGLRQQYVEDDRRLAEFSKKFGEDHIVVRNLRAEMAEIKKSIQHELGRIAESYQSDYEVARANEASVQSRLDQAIATTTRTNSDLVTLRSLESSAATYRSLFENFLQRFTQAVQDQSFPVPEARVITAAVPPKRKSEPKTTIILAMASVLGAGIGFAIAFTREALDRGIRSPGQLRAVTGLDCIGLLPRLRARRRWGRRVAGDRTIRPVYPFLAARPEALLRYVVDQPVSEFANVINGMRQRIVRRRLRSHDIKVIGCLANFSGAGASTVASNLAQSLALSGARTILLDWDAQNASLSQNMTGQAGPGCLDVLAGRTRISAATWHDRQTDLRFLAAGRGDIKSLKDDVSTSELLHELLSELRGEYGYVVVDLPPLSAIADVHLSAHLLDGLVLVTEWGRPDQDGLIDNLARIGLDETNIIGVVLNKANVKEARSYQVAAPDYARVGAAF